MNNKIAIITGAGHGIGKVVAAEFIKSGYKVITIAKSAPANYSFDISDYSEVKKNFKEISIKYKAIDVLINVAAIQGPIGSFSNNSLAQWEETLRVNLLGSVYCIRESISLITKKGGSIINFAGGGGLVPRENFSAYASSKAAVVRFTETLAKELNSSHIRVNAISPGAINTRMFEQMLAAGEKSVGRDEWQKLQAQKKSGGNDPYLVAKLCFWLASSRSKPLTGKTISAVYDDWQNWTHEQIKEIAASDWLTMRRLDKFTVEKLK